MFVVNLNDNDIVHKTLPRDTHIDLIAGRHRHATLKWNPAGSPQACLILLCVSDEERCERGETAMLENAELAEGGGAVASAISARNDLNRAHSGLQRQGTAGAGGLQRQGTGVQKQVSALPLQRQGTNLQRQGTNLSEGAASGGEAISTAFDGFKDVGADMNSGYLSGAPHEQAVLHRQLFFLSTDVEIDALDIEHVQAAEWNPGNLEFLVGRFGEEEMFLGKISSHISGKMFGFVGFGFVGRR